MMGHVYCRTCFLELGGYWPFKMVALDFHFGL